MNPEYNDPQFDHLRELLLPVLAGAAVGEFEMNLVPSRDASREFNEVLMGVQVLIEVIREQQAQIRQAEVRVADAQRRTTDILSRVLESSARPGRFDSGGEM
jgi:hypothetical protein